MHTPQYIREQLRAPEGDNHQHHKRNIIVVFIANIINDFLSKKLSQTRIYFGWLTSWTSESNCEVSLKRGATGTRQNHLNNWTWGSHVHFRTVSVPSLSKDLVNIPLNLVHIFRRAPDTLAPPLPPTTKVGGTYPTGMLSCYNLSMVPDT